MLWGPAPALWDPQLLRAPHAGLHGDFCGSLWVTQCATHAGTLGGSRGSIRLTHAFHDDGLMTHVSFHDACRVARTEQAFVLHQTAFLFLCRHESGNAAISVRVDLQHSLMQVLRFDINSRVTIFLSGEAYILSTAQDYLSFKTQTDQTVERSAGCAIRVREQGP